MFKKGVPKASIKAVLEAVVSLGDQVGALKSGVESKTEAAKEDILKEIRPIARAVDKDSETIIKHGGRITRIEKHLSLK